MPAPKGYVMALETSTGVWALTALDQRISIDWQRKQSRRPEAHDERTTRVDGPQ